MAYRENPVGVAQKQVLDALGLTATSFQDAQRKFDEIGIVVSSKRQGRTSIPVVIRISGGGRRNVGGDYDVWDAPSKGKDLSAIKQWMVD